MFAPSHGRQRGPLDGQVIRFRGAGGEDDLPGFGSDCLRDLLSRVLDGRGRLPPEPMRDARGIAINAR